MYCLHFVRNFQRLREGINRYLRVAVCGLGHQKIRLQLFQSPSKTTFVSGFRRRIVLFSDSYLILWFLPDKVNHVGSGLLPAPGALLKVEVDSVDLEVIFPTRNLLIMMTLLSFEFSLYILMIIGSQLTLKWNPHKFSKSMTRPLAIKCFKTEKYVYVCACLCQAMKVTQPTLLPGNLAKEKINLPNFSLVWESSGRRTWVWMSQQLDLMRPMTMVRWTIEEGPFWKYWSLPLPGF